MINLYNILVHCRFIGCNHSDVNLCLPQDSTYATSIQQSNKLLKLYVYKQFLINFIISMNLG